MSEEAPVALSPSVLLKPIPRGNLPIDPGPTGSRRAHLPAPVGWQRRVQGGMADGRQRSGIRKQIEGKAFAGSEACEVPPVQRQYPAGAEALCHRHHGGVREADVLVVEVTGGLRGPSQIGLCDRLAEKHPLQDLCDEPAFGLTTQAPQEKV